MSKSGQRDAVVTGRAIKVASLAALLYAVSRRLTRVQVEGLSMAPLLMPGDKLLALRSRAVYAGQVIAVEQGQRLIVKRVAEVGPQGVRLLGDNLEHSTDSRSFGLLPANAIIGRVVYRYAPAHRVGPLTGKNAFDEHVV